MYNPDFIVPSNSDNLQYNVFNPTDVHVYFLKDIYSKTKVYVLDLSIKLITLPLSNINKS